MLDSRTQSVIVAIATFVFFAGIAWEQLGDAPSWVRTVTGLGAAVLAVVALFALLKV